MENLTMETGKKLANKKLIKTWSDDLLVGIYAGEWLVRLYEDRATVRMPYVRWRGTTGCYAVETYRLTGQDHAALMEIARQEEADGEDYTHRVYDFVGGWR